MKIILPGQPEPAEMPTEGPRIQLTGLGDIGDAPGAASEPPSTGRASLLLDPSRIRALPEELRDYNCAQCDRRSAGWAFLPSNKGSDPDPVPICSLCWLYLSVWGRGREGAVTDFVCRLEKAKSKTFIKDAGGRLTDPRQGDEVLAQLLKASQVALRFRAQMRGFRES